MDDEVVDHLADYATQSFNLSQFLLNDQFAAHTLNKFTFGRYGMLEVLDPLVMKVLVAYILLIQILCKGLLENIFAKYKIAKSNSSRLSLKVLVSAIVNLYCNFSNSLLKSNPNNQVHLPIELRIFPSLPRVIDADYTVQSKLKDTIDAQYYYSDALNVADFQELFRKDLEKEMMDELNTILEAWLPKFQEKYKTYNEKNANLKLMIKQRLIKSIRSKNIRY